MARVFISYSRKRRRETVALAAALTDRDYRPWFDVNLTPGQDFETELEDQINRADAVVTIWTPEARNADWVRHESHLALQQNKLICVTAPDFNPGDIPHPFQKFHACECTDVDNIKRGLEAKGVLPVGFSPEERASEEQRTARAAIDWALVKDCGDAARLRAFSAAYGDLPIFTLLAAEKLTELQAIERTEAQAAWDRLGKSPAIPALIAFLAAHGGLAEFRDRATARLAEMNASAEQDARIRDILANLDSHEIYLRLAPAMHTALIGRISLAGDGAMMASASEDKTVKLWALPEGRLVRTLRPPIGEGNEGKVYAVAMDPAGRWVAAGGWMGENGTGNTFVTIFETDTGAVRARLGPLPNVVNDLEVSPDGARLAAGLSGTNGVRVWETAGWRQAWPATGYGGDVYGLAFAADGRLASTSFDGHVRLYGADGQLIAKARAPGGTRPYGIAVCPEGTRLALGYEDSLAVDVLDAASLTRLYSADTAGLEGGNLKSVAWLGGPGAGLRLAAGGTHWEGGEFPLFTWDAAGRGARRPWPGPDDTILDLAPTPDGGLALSGGEPSLALYSADGTRRLNKTPEIADLRNKLHEHFTVSADGTRLRFGLQSRSRTPVLFDLAALRLTDAPDPLPGLTPPDTTSLPVTGWEDGYAPALNVKSGLFGKSAPRPLELKQHETARSLAIAPDAKSFILGADWTLRRFDAHGSEIWNRPVPGVAWGVNLARSGRLLLAAYGDGTIRWHSAEDGAELLALFIHLPAGPAATAPQDRDWILWTPEGYYTASSTRAEALIGWHVNRGPDEAADFYPAETFAETFRRPDKVAAALDGV